MAFEHPDVQFDFYVDDLSASAQGARAKVLKNLTAAGKALTACVEEE